MPRGVPAAEPPFKVLLTVDQIAQSFQMSKASIYRLVQRRSIRFYRLAGVLRFDRADVEDFVQSGCFEPLG